MNVPFFIARRYLASRHRVSFISFISYFSIAGLAIGIAALCITLFILKGFEREIKQKVIAFDADIRVRLLGDSDIRNIEIPIEKIKKIHEIDFIAPFIEGQGMIRSKMETDGVIIQALSPEGFTRSLQVNDYIVKGKFDTTKMEGNSPLVIGNKLAEKLQVDIFDPVAIYTMEGILSHSRRPVVKRFYISGIYETGMADYDDIYVYTDLKSADLLFGKKGAFSGFNIDLTDPFSAGKISQIIVDSLGFPYFPLSWEDRHVNLFKWLKIQKFPILIVFGLILIVAVFNIVSTLVMVVLEKEHDISLLRSIGFSIRKVIFTFSLQGGIIGVAGSSLGISIALLFGILQQRFEWFKLPADVYFMDHVPVLMQVNDIVVFWSIGVVLSVIATIYPALKAASLKPSEILRYE